MAYLLSGPTASISRLAAVVASPLCSDCANVATRMTSGGHSVSFLAAGTDSLTAFSSDKNLAVVSLVSVGASTSGIGSVGLVLATFVRTKATSVTGASLFASIVTVNIEFSTDGASPCCFTGFHDGPIGVTVVVTDTTFPASGHSASLLL